MKKTVNLNKLSIDLTDESKKILEEIKDNTRIPFGRLINMLITSVCDMPPRLRDIIQKALENEQAFILDEMASTSKKNNEFFLDAAEKELGVITHFLLLIAKGHRGSVEKVRMQNIPLKDGHLIVPDNWIAVNKELAQNSRYAAILECVGEAGSKIPHFIYLFDGVDTHDFSSSKEKDFYTKCIEKCPEFKAVLEESESFSLAQNSDGTLQYPSIEDYLKKARVGIFFVGDSEDRPAEESPYGAVIIRSNIREV